MRLRRREDRTAPGRATQAAAGDQNGFEVLARGEWPEGAAASSREDATLPGLMLLRGTVGEEQMLLAGMPIGALPAGARGSAEVARAEAAWLEQWARVWKRNHLPDQMLSFFGQLSEAETEEAVCEAVADHAVRITGGYRAAVLLAEVGAKATDDAWRDFPRFERPGLIAADDLARLLSLQPAVDEPEISFWAHLPLSDHGILLLAERRSDRVFDVDDWAVLEAMAAHGARALERVWRLRRAREASLTDPLTGIANRRAMEVLLPHAWAAAARGEGLTLVMLDVDHFKEVNDTRGHPYGDQLLRIVADSLRQEARGADAVVRYGGDEFLLILPRSDAAGARALMRRVRQRLSGWVEVTEGIASYRLDVASPDALIAEADAALYAARAARRAPQRISGNS